MRTEQREGRQALITSAVLTIAAEEGLAKASLRSVARVADVSMGMVQHHFGTTERLLRDSLTTGLADMRSHIDAQTATTLHEEGPQAVVKAIALAHLQEDQSVIRLLRAIAEFRVMSAHDPVVKALVADNESHYRSAIADALTQAKQRRLLHKLVDPEPEAAVFWSITNALATDVALGLRDRDEARSLLRYHFRRLARNPRVTRPRGRQGNDQVSDRA